MSEKNFNPATLANFRLYWQYFLNSHWRNLRRKSVSINFWIMLCSDVLCIAIAYMLAYALRFEAFLLHERQLYYSGSLVLVLGVKLPVFYLLGLYNGMWRYTGLRDLQNIVLAVFVSSATIVSLMLFINRFQGFSRAVFIMDAIICLLLLCTTRVIIRFALQHSRFRREDRPKKKKRLLLIGAGDAAEKAVREISDNPKLPYEVVGFVDDNPRKTGQRIHGIPVLGKTDNLINIAEQTKAEELLIAIVAIDATNTKRIVDLCQHSGLPHKILPGLGEIIRGKLSVTHMRDISYCDLLGREEVTLDQKQIGSYLTDKTVLVTGAGGSIGSELCRQIIGFKPKQLVLFDAGEENLYNIEMELLHDHQFIQLVPVLGRVQDQALLSAVFSEYQPSVVFHAAAYKHVPLLEKNPWEGVINNVIGSQCLVETALRHNVERFVLVSTDKAVRPTNVMGATKRLTELIMLAACEQPNTEKLTKFMAVRFGNVLGSSGSVIPLFKKQIEKGGPVTVTHPEITRYFMSISEAAQLILQAGAMGTGGELFLLKMGQPIKIVDLARDLIKLLGQETDGDIKIAYTGLRPGEKLYEELITAGEGIVPTRHDKIMVLRGDIKPDQDLQELLNSLAKLSKAHDAKAIKQILKIIIPEYTPDGEARSIIDDRYNSTGELRN